jgi:hypothetical protein
MKSENTAYERWRTSLWSVLAMAGFLLVVFLLRTFHPEGAGFERKGLALVTYHLCRLALVFYLVALNYGVGYRAFEILRISPIATFGSARKAFILCFFFGATLYGALFTALGLAGLINLTTALVCTVPILFLSIRPVAELANGVGMEFADASVMDPYAGKYTVRLVALVVVGAALLFLTTDVVFVAVYDPNIWEHYLHYYRAVLHTGSTLPGEVWHHFYASKAAGLILLTDVLGDYFGAQIVSACFVIAATIVIVDILFAYCESASWVLFGAAVFLLFMCGDAVSGAMFKHHVVLLGYASFALWGAVQLQEPSKAQRKPLMIALVGAMFYLGFYLPVTGVLFPAAFLFAGIANLIFRDRQNIYPLLTVALAVMAGAVLVFGVNWILTGLPELTPIRLIWSFADHAKAEKTFGLGGIQFFLRNNNDVNAEYDGSLHLIWHVLRYPVPVAALAATLIGGIFVLVHDLVFRPVHRSLKLLAYLVAFVLPLSAFAQVMQSTNVTQRMGLFSIVFTTMAVVVIWKRLVDLCPGLTLCAYELVTSLRLGPKDVVAFNPEASPISMGRFHPVWIRVVAFQSRMLSFFTWRRFFGPAISLVVGAGLAAFEFSHSTDNLLGYRFAIAQFASGRMSMKDTFSKIEESEFNAPFTGITVKEMLAYRKTAVRDHERILRLTYDGGFAYSLPGDGIVSEPTYALVDDPAKTYAASPNDVEQYLRNRNIAHFTINLKRPLFSTFAFTSLFDPSEMPKHFRVSYEDDDKFILTWREDNSPDATIPDYLLNRLDLKRAAVLSYPFTDHFAGRVIDGCLPLPDCRRGDTLDVELAPAGVGQIDSIIAYQKAHGDVLANLDDVLEGMLSRLSMNSSREMLVEIWGPARHWLAQLPVRAFLKVRREPREGYSVTHFIPERELKMRMLEIFRDELRKEYLAELGPDFAALAESWDERVPYGKDYPSWAKSPE